MCKQFAVNPVLGGVDAVEELVWSLGKAELWYVSFKAQRSKGSFLNVVWSFHHGGLVLVSCTDCSTASGKASLEVASSADTLHHQAHKSADDNAALIYRGCEGKSFTISNSWCRSWRWFMAAAVLLCQRFGSIQNSDQLSLLVVLNYLKLNYFCSK